MDTPKPGYVDFYFKGRIFEVEERDPLEAADCITNLLSDTAQSDALAAIGRIRAQYHIREVGIEAEAGTNDLRNPLWLKLDTSRRLAGMTGREVDPHVADLIRSAGIIGDGRMGNPIAFCVSDSRTDEREIWRINPREIEALSRRQIEDQLVAWVTQAVESGILP